MNPSSVKPVPLTPVVSKPSNSPKIDLLKNITSYLNCFSLQSSSEEKSPTLNETIQNLKEEWATHFEVIRNQSRCAKAKQNYNDINEVLNAIHLNPNDYDKIIHFCLYQIYKNDFAREPELKFKTYKKAETSLARTFSISKQDSTFNFIIYGAPTYGIHGRRINQFVVKDDSLLVLYLPKKNKCVYARMETHHLAPMHRTGNKDRDKLSKYAIMSDKELLNYFTKNDFVCIRKGENQITQLKVWEFSPKTREERRSLHLDSILTLKNNITLASPKWTFDIEYILKNTSAHIPQQGYRLVQDALRDSQISEEERREHLNFILYQIKQLGFKDYSCTFKKETTGLSRTLTLMTKSNNLFILITHSIPFSQTAGERGSMKEIKLNAFYDVLDLEEYSFRFARLVEGHPFLKQGRTGNKLEDLLLKYEKSWEDSPQDSFLSDDFWMVLKGHRHSSFLAFWRGDNCQLIFPKLEKRHQNKLLIDLIKDIHMNHEGISYDLKTNNVVIPIDHHALVRIDSHDKVFTFVNFNTGLFFREPESKHYFTLKQYENALNKFNEHSKYLTLFNHTLLMVALKYNIPLDHFSWKEASNKEKLAQGLKDVLSKIEDITKEFSCPMEIKTAQIIAMLLQKTFYNEIPDSSEYCSLLEEGLTFS